MHASNGKMERWNRIEWMSMKSETPSPFYLLLFADWNDSCASCEVEKLLLSICRFGKKKWLCSNEWCNCNWFLERIPIATLSLSERRNNQQIGRCETHNGWPTTSTTTQCRRINRETLQNVNPRRTYVVLLHAPQSTRNQQHYWFEVFEPAAVVVVVVVVVAWQNWNFNCGIWWLPRSFCLHVPSSFHALRSFG